MREMWVDPKYYNRRSFGCFETPKDMIPGVDDILNAKRVIVMDKEEWDNFQGGINKIGEKLVKILNNQKGINAKSL